MSERLTELIEGKVLEAFKEGVGVGWTAAEEARCPELVSRLHSRILDLEDALEGWVTEARVEAAAAWVFEALNGPERERYVPSETWPLMGLEMGDRNFVRGILEAASAAVELTDTKQQQGPSDGAS